MVKRTLHLHTMHSLRFIMLYLQIGGLVVEFTPDIDISSTSSHGSSSDKTTLDQLVWIIPHDLSVLACSWLSLISVHHQILRPA